MKKLRNILNVPKNSKIFIIVFSIIAIISGSLFYFYIDINDQNVIKTYVENLIINNEYNSFLTILGTNYFLILLIWIFGLSVIGILINLFLYFFKVFLISLSLTALINIYGFNGVLLGTVYIFPHQIISLIIYFILVIYSINLSLTIIESIILKRELNFSKIMIKYNKVFLVSIIIISIVVLYETYLLPYILKLVGNLIL